MPTLRPLAFLVAAAMLAAHAGARADAMDDAVRSYIRSDYTTAYQILAPMVEQGNAAAEAMVATMYRYGEGVEIDPEKSARLYRMASLQGDVGAQYNLAQLYLTGFGVEQSITHALMWLTIALDEMGYEEFVRDSGASVRQPITEFRQNVVSQAGFFELARALDMAAQCRKSKYKDCE